MHKIVMWLGWSAIGLGCFFFLMIAILARDADRSGQVFAALIIGGSLILSGAMLYCFGAIVEHLIAIRKATERQVAIFDRLGQPKL